MGLNALRLRGGMGAAQAPISEPHPLQTREAFLLKRAPCGMQHPMLPGAWGEQPHKPKPPHSKIFTPFSKNHFRRILCPRGHRLGLNALRLRGGMGAARAPISNCTPCKPAKSFCLKGHLLGSKALRLRGCAGGIREQKMCIFGEIKRIGMGAGGAFLVL